MNLLLVTLVAHGMRMGSYTQLRGAVDHLTAHGCTRLALPPELLRSQADPVATAELPPSIRDTVRLRLDGLPGSARRCLDLLSVAGHELDLQVLAAALDVTAPAVAEGLAPAYTAALVTEAGPGAVTFCHPLIAEVTYAELVPPRRAEERSASCLVRWALW